MASTYQKKVMEYSPIIASKLAMSTALMTPGEIAKELRQLLDNNVQNNNDFQIEAIWAKNIQEHNMKNPY